jgi:DNA-binding response OmpR family regulator
MVRATTALETFNNFTLEAVTDVNVLILEKDQEYIDILQALLKNTNFNLQAFTSVSKALAELKKRQDYGLVITSAAFGQPTNINNPDIENSHNSSNISSEKLIDQIRAITTAPIIVLTEPLDEMTIGAEAGANLMLEGADYALQKPFTPRRLKAAVTAVLRRNELNSSGDGEVSQTILPEKLVSGDFSLSLGRLELSFNGRKISLSNREFSLLQFLMTNPDREFTREELAAQAWGWSKGGEMRALDSAIKRLRRKIELDSRKPQYIVTARNIGYRFNSKLNSETNSPH